MNGAKAKRMRRHWLRGETGVRKYRVIARVWGGVKILLRDDGYTQYRQAKRLVSRGAPQYSKTDPGEKRRRYRARKAARVVESRVAKLKELAHVASEG